MILFGPSLIFKKYRLDFTYIQEEKPKYIYHKFNNI